MGRILHVFWETDMRAGQAGLADIAKKEGKKLSEIPAGDFLVFINSSQDRIKVLAKTPEKDTYGILSCYRSPHGRISLDAVQYIPQSFGVDGFNMSKAIEKALREKLKRKRGQEVPSE